MALFQQSVITKHLQSLDQKLLDTKWNEFASVFHNSEKQTNIRNSKEEQYQEGFLRDLFVQIFGYTINPETNFNLLTEQKNQTNSKKADGAILINGKVKAVIELKGTDTTDLNKIETQAFGYKNNQSECVYVITSNFERIRFYIDNAIDFVEFNLFQLTKDDFALLYMCLSFDNIKNNIPKHLKDESVSQENKITKQLYKDYSEFKRGLYNNLVELNPEYDKLLLFKKTQKLLDRFLFIFFAEDRLLLPTNLIRRINLEWKNLRDARVQVSLYDRYKMYFEDLNKGAMVTLPAFGKKTGDAITAEFEIFAYNGGLFLPDEVLDAVKIDDALLYDHSHKMSDYNFLSEVDVNILGHIFENSLNEIDEIKSEIEGNEIDKTKTRRKKDGVFYTPKYITKYIVDNTIGKLCEEKKTEFQIIDEEFAKGRKNRNKTTIEKLDKALHTYRDWLLQITICDPACGSGAFLNQALEFLIQEHKYIDSLESQLLGYSFEFPGTEMHILENNIYGVDLNDESVEIAKLSLWLRTAQKGRKLNSLNNNIKCGNSLIDDVSVAGEKAFSWEKEFPEVFEKGGFDILIGNPPYGASLNNIEKDFIRNTFESMEGDFDTYIYFIEISLKIGKKFGECGFIIPNNILQQKFCRKIRRILIENTTLNTIIDLGNGVFEGAVVPTTILNYKLQVSNPNNEVDCLFRPLTFDFYSGISKISQSDFNNLEENYSFNIQLSNVDKKILKKLDKEAKKLKEVCELKIGIEGIPDLIHEEPISDISKPMVRGRNFNRYFIDFENDPKYIEYDRKLLHRPREERLFTCPRKLLIRQTGDRIISTIDLNKLYAWKSVFVILSDENKLYLEYLLALLNSSTINYYYQKIVGEGGRVFAQVKGINLDKLPIKIIPVSKQILFKEKVDLILKLNLELKESLNKFQKRLKTDYNLLKLSSSIENFYDLSPSDFFSELKKLKIELKAVEKDDLQEYFESHKNKILTLKSNIDKTDKEIDQMVYELYGLTNEEIKIVEAN